MRRRGSLVSRVRADRRGAVAIITALSLSVILALAALVVDIGLAYMSRAEVQAATDMDALTAGWLLPTGNLQAIEASSAASFSGVAGGALLQTSPGLGVYTPSASTPRAQRFSSGAYWSCAAQGNALQVQAGVTTPISFGQLFSNATGLTSTVSATATRNVGAAYTVSSGLLSVSQVSTMNAVLGGLLGANVSLQAVDYSNLLNANVNALSFINALATQLHITSGTYNSILSSSASIGNIVSAEIAVLATQGSTATAAISSLQTLASEVNLTGSTTFQVSQLISLGSWGNQALSSATPPAAVFGQMNVFNLLSFAAQAANGKNGFNISSTGLSIPGVATMSLNLTAVEPAQPSFYSFSTPCTSVHTAQIRVYLQFSLLSKLTVVGLPILNAPVAVSIYTQTASGTGTLWPITCPSSAPGNIGVQIQASSAAQTFQVGSVSPSAMTNFTTDPVVNPDTLVNVVSVVSITGSSSLRFLSSSNVLTFNFPPPGQQTATQTQTISSFGTKSNAVGVSLMSSQKAALTVSLLGILNTKANGLLVSAAMAPILTTLGTAIDPTLDAVFGAMGLNVATVNVGVSGARCSQPVLVE